MKFPALSLWMLLLWGPIMISKGDEIKNDVQPVLFPVEFNTEKKTPQLSNHTTQLSVNVVLNNGTVAVAGQELEPDNMNNVNALLPLQLYSPNGNVLSSATVSTEARAMVVETKKNGMHLLRMQMLVTSIDSQEVIVVSIPEVRLFLGKDGTEKRRTVTLINADKSLLLLNVEPNIELENEEEAFSSITEKSEGQEESVVIQPQPVIFEPKEPPAKVQIMDPATFCPTGCPTNGNCLRPEPMLCMPLPPAMRLAICGVLLCLAAFLLMLFVHIFVVRPSNRPHRSSGLYARNMRIAWAYSPLPDKEACA